MLNGELGAADRDWSTVDILAGQSLAAGIGLNLVRHVIAC